MRSLILGVLLALTLTSCAANKYVVHPGSINTFDSVTADTLTIVKATIDQTRPKLASGALPASLAPFLTSLIKAYNAADGSYKTWRDLAATNPAAATTQLQTDLAALSQALAQYTAAGGK